MYVGVAVVLLGWALTFHSRTLLIYAAGVITAFHLRIVLGEEPWLARAHGDAWMHYKSRVPRWIGPVRAISAFPD
jgi:protein-S-isoprenylcysteine O-methyltransferase Ste14